MRVPKTLVSIACLFLLLAGALRAQAPQGDVAAKATAILDALARGDFAGAARDFDARMQEVLPVGKLQATWQSLVAQVGPPTGSTSGTTTRPRPRSRSSSRS